MTPKLFNIGDEPSSSAYGSSYKILYTRRNRYNSIKLSSNAASGGYSTSINGNSISGINGGYVHSLQGI